jgi:hypothetical protein
MRAMCGALVSILRGAAASSGTTLSYQFFSAIRPERIAPGSFRAEQPLELRQEAFPELG